MNIHQALEQAQHDLGKSTSPTLDAEVLLAHVLHVERGYLLAHREKRLNPVAVIRYRWLVARRQHGIPLAYLVGYKDFYGRRFKVNRATLIPRPETEGLVERALSLARQHGLDNIIDVGTGTGCIAISLAAELTNISVMACDVSARALVVARRNARAHGVYTRLQLLRGNLLEPAIRLGLMTARSLVVANLPYLTPREVQGEITFEPRGALVGGADGLACYRTLLQQLAALPPEQWPGWLVLEVHPPTINELLALLKNILPKSQAGVNSDLAGLPRILTVALA